MAKTYPELEIPDEVTVASASVIETLSERDALIEVLAEFTGINIEKVADAVFGRVGDDGADGLKPLVYSLMGGRGDDVAFDMAHEVVERRQAIVEQRLRELLLPTAQRVGRIEQRLERIAHRLGVAV